MCRRPVTLVKSVIGLEVRLGSAWCCCHVPADLVGGPHVAPDLDFIHRAGKGSAEEPVAAAEQEFGVCLCSQSFNPLVRGNHLAIPVDRFVALIVDRCGNMNPAPLRKEASHQVVDLSGLAKLRADYHAAIAGPSDERAGAFEPIAKKKSREPKGSTTSVFTHASSVRGGPRVNTGSWTSPPEPSKNRPVCPSSNIGLASWTLAKIRLPLTRLPRVLSPRMTTPWPSFEAITLPASHHPADHVVVSAILDANSNPVGHGHDARGIDADFISEIWLLLAVEPVIKRPRRRRILRSPGRGRSCRSGESQPVAASAWLPLSSISGVPVYPGCEVPSIRTDDVIWGRGVTGKIV